MKNSGWKRLCSLLLALVMALSLTPVHLYAAEREPAAEPTDSDSGFSADYAGEYTLVSAGSWEVGTSYTYAQVLVAPGEFPTLQVQATSDDPDSLTYHWFSGTYYSAESGFVDSEEVWDATSDAYTVTDLTRRWYRCMVSDGYGNSRSLYFYAGVDNAFAVEPVGETSVTVLLGQSVTLQVAVSATDLSRVTYQWYGRGNTISGADTDTLVMDAPMSGSYRCTVSDGYGNSGTIYFTVMVDSGFSADYAGEYTLVSAGSWEVGTSYTYAQVLVAPGEFPTLQVQGTSNDPDSLTYHWFSGTYYSAESGFVDSEEVWDATSDAYTVTDLTRRWYRCMVSDGYGNSRSLYFYAGVDNAFAVEPVGETSVTVLPGQSVTLQVAVSATDLSRVTYQWYDVDIGTAIGDAVSDTFTVESVTAQKRYYCRVEDGYGSSQTVYFTVTVDNNLSVERVGEENVYVAPGESVTLQVIATANDMEGMTYRWWSDNRGNIPGATADTFTVENVTGGDWYYCEVRDKYGNTNSTSFFVGVDNGFSVERVGDYEVYVAPGESATLQVIATANDMEGMTYRWWSNNRGNIPGATADTFTVENVTGSDWYYCEVTDKYGSSRTIDFYVCVDNHLTVERVGDYEQRVAPGESATLQVIASADDMDGITYQWYRQSSSNMRDGGDWWWEPIEGATTDTCTVENVTDTREYYCHVEDQYGNSINEWFRVGIENHLRVERVGDYEHLVSPGESVTLQVRATADDMEGITYRWYEVNNSGMRDGGEWILIEGADTDTCTVENVRATREYVCEVSDKYGSYANEWFQVGIENHLRVERVTPYENLVSPGESVTLQVRATADDMEGITYQWYGWVYHSGPVGLVRDGGSGGGWYEPIEGADTDTLTVENVTDTRQYYCRVTDKYGSYANAWFRVGIENHLRVARVTPYQNLVSPGESVTLQVRATADDMEGITYQWRTYRDGYGETDIPGATTDTYTVENVTDTREYYCQVTDKYGTTFNEWFEVGIQNHLKAWAVGGGTVTVEPGENATMQVAFSADDPEGVTYQWYIQPIYREATRDAGWSIIPGATTDTYTAENVTEDVKYCCYVTDRYGTTAEVWFNVWARIKTAAIVSQPQDYTGALNDYATFHVEAEGHGLTYMWQSNASGVWKNTSFATSKTDTLRVKITAVRNGVRYRCVVTDEFGNKATSRGAALYVEEWEPLVLISQPEDYIGPVGEYATFRVEATGMGLTYMWQNDVTGRWTNTSFATSKEPELRVKITEARNGCNYRCVITDELGDMIASQPAALWVEVPQGPIITAQPQDFTGPVGTYAAFHVEATGEGLTYQWQSYTNGKWVNNSFASSKTDTLSVKITAARDGAQYRCVVTDAAGLQAISDPATLHVGVVLAIVGQPEDFTGPIGTYATFRVEATGEGLTYQWQSYTGSKWVNNNFASSKTDTLSVKITAARDGAQYRCVVTDTKGETVISEPATLHVGVVLAIVSQPENFTGAIGEYATFHVEATGEELTYQWQSFSGGKWVNNSFATSKTDTLSVKITAARDGAQYRCVITDAKGESLTSEPATLHVG